MCYVANTYIYQPVRGMILNHAHIVKQKWKEVHVPPERNLRFYRENTCAHTQTVDHLGLLLFNTFTLSSCAYTSKRQATVIFVNNILSIPASAQLVIGQQPLAVNDS